MPGERVGDEHEEEPTHGDAICTCQCPLSTPAPKESMKPNVRPVMPTLTLTKIPAAETLLAVPVIVGLPLEVVSELWSMVADGAVVGCDCGGGSAVTVIVTLAFAEDAPVAPAQLRVYVEV